LVSAGVFAAIGVLMLVLYAAPELQGRHEWLAMAASFAPYGWLAWLAALVLALAGARGRSRLVAATLALGLAWHTGVLVPYLPEPTRAAAGPKVSVSVLELNLRYGLADLTALADRVREHRPDVLVLPEATAATERTLRHAAWSKDFPYLVGTAGNDYDKAKGIGDPRGTLVASRYPVSELDASDGTIFSNFAVRLELPGRAVTLIAAHPANPEHGVDTWLRDAESLTRLAMHYSPGPVVLAGDLNATAEHLTLRELKAKAGLADTVVGQGWRPTFPADAWYPPLIQIDHVLVSAQFTATGYRTLRIPGTDHLGLLVQLSLS
jgi:endonuclease/exonuclease/phosphatase (EEP) superfamily protein YafD